MDSKQAIENNLDYIVQHTSNISRLLFLLVENGIIDTSKKNELEAIQMYDERLQNLFLTLSSKTFAEELEVLKFLRRTGNSHVADKLLGKATLKSIKSIAALQVYYDYKNKNTAKIPMRRIFFVIQEGEAENYENFENIAPEIGKELEVLSLKYVQAMPTHILKALESCDNLNIINLHNVKFIGTFPKAVQLKSLLDFSYVDDFDLNGIQQMSIDERLEFLQQLLFFVPKKKMLHLQSLQVQITICISNHNYVKISEYENQDPFQIFNSRRESISVIEEAFAEIDF